MPPAKAYNATLSAIFGVVILCGSAGAFVPYDTVPAMREQRSYASFPSFNELRHPTLIPTQIAAFFSDNFGGRKFLVREYFRFRLQALGADIGLPATLGKEGSLIVADEILSYRRDTRSRPLRLERMRRVLNSWCIYARERGAAFVFAIAPNKTTIHPFVPDYLSVLDKPSVIDTIYALPLDCPAIKVDLRVPLRDNANELLYYKWGTHWNDHAALIAWRAIKEAVDRNGPRFTWPTSKLAVTRRAAAPHEDSVWSWFGLPDPQRTTLNHYTFTDIKYDSTAGADIPPRARILAFGDSFLLFMEPTAYEVMGTFSAWNLSPHDRFAFTPSDLSKDGWILPVHPPQKRIELMDIFQPNIVILEVVERGIAQFADFSLPPGHQ